jgi:VWFA-related protein
MSVRVGCGFLLLGLGAGLGVCQTQTSGNQPAAGQHGYTLQTQARIVLTDVTVTDRHGNPVRGLKESAFHIFDNGTEEKLSSFEEHTGLEPNSIPAAQTDPHVFGNSLLLHPPRVFNVILLDTTTINVFDQMYLNEELTKFVQELPADQPFAVYARAGEYAVLLQDFTTDHDLLLKGIHEAIPRLKQPGADYYTDVETLDQICKYLSQYPGRKNVLWFSGGSNFFLMADPGNPFGGPLASVNLQPLYDELEAARIAIYPIDARGLVVDISTALPEQQMLMQEEAEATGGQAIINTNGLAQAAEQIMNTDASFYTLTYAPHDVKFDNKWHKVKIGVDGGDYTLSYRRGYYDDGANAGRSPTSPTKRSQLLANGEKAPAIHNEPIQFTVRVLPVSESPEVPAFSVVKSSTPAKRDEMTYSLHYSLPAEAFLKQKVDGQEHAVLGVGVMAINHYGRLTGRVMEKVTVRFTDDQMNATPSGLMSFDQQVNLPKGQDSLYIAVWDMATGRIGTVQLPLDVAKR